MGFLTNTVKKFKIYGLKNSVIFLFAEILYLGRKLFRKSYSQSGEDIIIAKYFKNKKTGYYIDVGANDPIRYNNTKKFYDLGWNGINIEPNPTKHKKLVQARLRDTNLNIGITKKASSTTFYEIFPDTLSTFSEEYYKHSIEMGFILTKRYKISTFTLEEILKKYKVNNIDFLSIDTEGFDLEALKSLPWDKKPPELICIERAELTDGSKDYKAVQFLISKGYKIFSKTKMNYILINKYIKNSGTDILDNNKKEKIKL